MRNSWKLGAYVALGASVAFIGCGDDANDGDNDKGGSGGSSAGKGGQAGGGKAGQNTGGASAGTGGGGGTPNGGSSAGKGGSGGKGGSAPEGGSGSEGGSTGEGMGGGGGDASVPECTDDELSAGGASDGAGGGGGADAGSEVTTAVVLIDNVQVKSTAATVVEWQFADGTTISDATDYPADKWSRIIFDPGGLGDEAGAHCTFIGCDGDPAAGSLKAVVPFTAINQYFELGVPFAADDFSNTTVTARVKLISGGKPDAACPVRGQLYSTGTTPKNDAPGFALIEGQWVTLTMELGAGFAGTDRVGIRLNTYGC